MALIDQKKIYRPRQDSNLQSSDPKSDALSIRPRGHPYIQRVKKRILTKFIQFVRKILLHQTKEKAVETTVRYLLHMSVKETNLAVSFEKRNNKTFH